jgi:hypothetical protein
MTWLMLDDSFHWDADIAALTNDAYRLEIGGMSVCCAHATGQVLPRARFAQAAQGVRRPKRALAELLRAGLWKEVEEGWWIRFQGLARLPNREQARAAAQASVEARQARREAAEEASNPSSSAEQTANDRSTTAQRPLSDRSAVRVRACVRTHGRAGIPIPEPSRERDRGGTVENPEPVENSGPLPPGVIARARLLEGLAEEILVRPVTALERDVLLGWAQLRRGGRPVAIDEIAEAARREMARPGANGVPASSLRWADGGVQALARQPLDHQVVRPRAAPGALAARTLATEASALRDLGLDPGELRALPGGAG